MVIQLHGTFRLSSSIEVRSRMIGVRLYKRFNGGEFRLKPQQLQRESYMVICLFSLFRPSSSSTRAAERPTRTSVNVKRRKRHEDVESSGADHRTMKVIICRA